MLTMNATGASYRCLICRKPVDDYEPEYCCDGTGCSCGGRPVEPCVCSIRCERALTEHIGNPRAKRRKLAGIPLWKPNVSVSEERMDVAEAREVMRKAFEDDPDFRRSYQDNIAMYLHDHHGITNHKDRNEAADGIIKLIFET